ncbi:RING finger protein 11-like [Tropilaelaps mercedesae]|uniref:RING finger protein 11-like n=1 Tax=Tropilaelaps mercedesae TaxID=418985 RepID=A0A1V9X8M3_9ACAR|nr:RING finger protein 11-like [Tropilaelaps mercedesae]
MGNCLKCANGDSLSLLREPSDSLSSSGDTESVFLSIPAPSHPAGAPVRLVGGAPRASQEHEEDLKDAQRRGFIRQLPKGPFDGRGGKECPICMNELTVGDPVRFLPCLHCYHADCIDDWLLRSLTCPSCLEPVDAALLSSYQAP